MRFPLWQVDAFTRRRLAGNPAAVVVLEDWLPDATLLAIAAENNLSETAYLVPDGGDFHIRWFTPTVEVALCGHATLASAWVVLERLEPGRARVVFQSQSGPLPVDRSGERLVLDFPARRLEPVVDASAMRQALGGAPREILGGFAWLALYESEAEVRALAPNMAALVETGVHGAIATAPGTDCDFVSRYFAPAAGVPEDPVTGSAHTLLAPFWAERLSKRSLFARQVSARGGELWCTLEGERVRIAGHVTPYLEGKIEV